MRDTKKYSWFVVGLLWGVALLNYMDRQMLATMRPSMQTDIAELRSAENFGYLMAIFLWIYGCMSPVAGVIADRLNRKWLIVLSLLVWSGVTFSMGYAENFHELYVLRAIMGISEALYIPAALSLIADYHESRTRSLAIGIHMTGIYLGQALGGFGATVAGLFSWRSTFHTFGFIGIAYAVVLVFLLKEKRGSRLTDKRVVHPPPAPFFKGLGRLLVRLSFWIILCSFAVASLPGWAVKNWLPTLFSQNLQLDMSKAGPISTISIAVFSLLGVLFGGAMSDQWAAKNVRGRIYTSCIGLSLTIPALLLVGFGHSAVSTVGAMFCFGFGYGMADANYMPILCQFVSPDSRATAYGLMNMTGVFAGAFITGQLGKLTDAGNLGMGFAALAAFVLLGVTIQYFFLKPQTSNA